MNRISSLKAVNSGLAFLLELAMLAAFGYWGFQTGSSLLMKWGLGLGVPLAVAVLWGLFLAPKSKRRLNAIPGTIASLGLFWLAALALYQAHQPGLAVALALIALANRTLILWWKQW